jgi:hypothetical protein
MARPSAILTYQKFITPKAAIPHRPELADSDYSFRAGK